MKYSGKPGFRYEFFSETGLPASYIRGNSARIKKGRGLIASALVSNFFTLPYCLALLIVIVVIIFVFVFVRSSIVRIGLDRSSIVRIGLDCSNIVRSGQRNADEFRYAVGVCVDTRTGVGVAFRVEQHYYGRSQSGVRSRFLLILFLLNHYLLVLSLVNHYLLSKHRTQTASECCPHKCISRKKQPNKKQPNPSQAPLPPRDLDEPYQRPPFVTYRPRLCQS